MNFQELRERAGFTQQSLADAIGRHQTLISKIERGHPIDVRWSTISALASALSTTPEAVAKAIRKTQAA